EELDAENLRSYLLAYLPEYMVPQYYVWQESFRLTANGKIDRRALPLPELNTEEIYQAPASEIEEQMVVLWSEVLKLPADQISVTQGFFALGGHSLRATILINRVNQFFGKSLPLKELFQYSSIRTFCERIVMHDSTNPRRVKDLVLLSEESEEQSNIFFIHDGSGDIHSYLELSRYIQNYSCWGIRSGTLDSYAPSNQSWEEIAANYVTKIKAVQSEGPYNIAGWSLGGLMALEIVRQLETTGEQVEMFFMIDSVLRHDDETHEFSQEFSLESEKSIIEEFLGIDKVTLQNAGDDIEELWDFAVSHLDTMNTEEVRGNIPDQYRKVIPDVENLEIPDVIRYINTIRSLIRSEAAWDHASITSIDTRLHYLGAADTDFDAELFSGYFNNKDIRIETLEGDHFSIMRKPGIQEVAIFIDAYVPEKAGSL
ncbi:MAG: thioesterase domain-containing protein, partial [Cyclobacteriaceae bacterium]